MTREEAKTETTEAEQPKQEVRNKTTDTKSYNICSPNETCVVDVSELLKSEKLAEFESFLKKIGVKEGDWINLSTSEEEKREASIEFFKKCCTQVSKENPAGAALNTLTTLGLLIGGAVIISETPHDCKETFGRLFSETNTECVSIHEEHEGTEKTIIYVITNPVTKQRTGIIFDGKKMAVTPEDIANRDNVIKNSKFSFFTGFYNPRIPDATDRAIEIARAAGKKVALSPSSVDCIRRNRDYFKSLVAGKEGEKGKVDVLFVNEEEAQEFFSLEDKKEKDIKGLTAHEFLTKNQNMTVVVTRGSEGVIAIQGGKIFESPAIQSDKPVLDTTGAGDSFAGGFIAARCEGKNIQEALEIANKVARVCVELIGPRPNKDGLEGISEELRFQEVGTPSTRWRQRVGTTSCGVKDRAFPGLKRFNEVVCLA